jgi:RHS repeat-associated protein
MAMTVRYTVVDGEVIAEKRNGVRSLYVPDPLGSTVALLDNNQTQTDTFSYWPYGEENVRTGTTPTPFRFVGTVGCYRDSASKTNMRARILDTAKGRWATQDPLSLSNGDINLYRYVFNDPTTLIDPSGEQLPGNPIQQVTGPTTKPKPPCPYCACGVPGCECRMNDPFAPKYPPIQPTTPIVTPGAPPILFPQPSPPVKKRGPGNKTKGRGKQKSCSDMYGSSSEQFQTCNQQDKGACDDMCKNNGGTRAGTCCCEYTVSRIGGGVTFVAHATCNNGTKPRPQLRYRP